MRNVLIAGAIGAIAFAGPALAGGDLSRANVITVPIELGSADGGMYVRPNTFEFVTGQAYKLSLVNVDVIKHELALNEMGERIFTRKVQIDDADGNLVAEIKGQIREIEVGPGKTVDWYIVPIQTLDESQITCELEGHMEAGMWATVTIK